MVTHVFYDYDGVLADSFHSLMVHYKDIADGLGVPVDFDPDNYEECKEIARRYSPTFLSEEGFSEAQAKLYLDSVKTNLGNHQKYDYGLFHGVPEMIRNVNDRFVSQLVLSQGSAPSISGKLDDNKILSYFRNIFGSDDLKPLGYDKGKFLERFLEQEGLDPQEVLFIDDHELSYDQVKDLGINFIGVSYGYSIKPEDDRFPNAKSPEELPRMVLDTCKQ